MPVQSAASRSLTTLLACLLGFTFLIALDATSVILTIFVRISLFSAGTELIRCLTEHHEGPGWRCYRELLGRRSVPACDVRFATHPVMHVADIRRQEHHTCFCSIVGRRLVDKFGQREYGLASPRARNPRSWRRRTDSPIVCHLRPPSGASWTQVSRLHESELGSRNDLWPDTWFGAESKRCLGKPIPHRLINDPMLTSFSGGCFDLTYLVA